jgi:hypothetical protein
MLEASALTPLYSVLHTYIIWVKTDEAKKNAKLGRVAFVDQILLCVCGHACDGRSGL